jgi:superfamily II DNA or RNA helicase
VIPPETPEEKRRRQAQTKFGMGGDTSRQQRLFAGEKTLGGALFIPPTEAERKQRAASPERLGPPGPRLSEFGGEGVARPERVTVPAPTATPPTPRPQPTLQEPPPPTEAPRTEFVVRPVPLDVARHWRAPFMLRPDQWEAIRVFHQYHKGSIVFPTGVGKTEIALGILNDLRIPTVVIVPSLPLVDQWVERMSKWGIRAGVWTGVSHQPNYVTVSTYQSLYSDPTLVRQFPFIVFDEADLATADEFRKLILESQMHPYAVALTATEPADFQRRDLMRQYLPVIARQTTGEAIERGQLTPVQVIPRATPLNGAERRAYDKLAQTLTFRAQRMGTSNPRQVQRLLRDLTYRNDAIAFLRALSERRRLLSNVESKEAALLQIIQENPHQRILIFSESVPAVEDACRYLREHGTGCHTFTGQTDPRTRAQLLANWGKTFFVLASVYVLQRGIDVPEASIAVFVASGTGRLQLTQRLGRILRLSPGKEKATAYVLFSPDTSEARVVQKLQRLAGSDVTVQTPRGLDEWDDDDESHD